MTQELTTAEFLAQEQEVLAEIKGVLLDNWRNKDVIELKKWANLIEDVTDNVFSLLAEQQDKTPEDGNLHSRAEIGTEMLIAQIGGAMMNVWISELALSRENE